MRASSGVEWRAVRRPTPLAAALALLLAALVAPRAARADDELRPVPLESLRGKLDAKLPHAFTEQGLEIVVDGNVSTALPLNAQELELDVEATGPVMLTWASWNSGGRFLPFGPPWRHLTLPRERTRLRLDLRTTVGWSLSSQPTLGLTGEGRVVIHGLRAVPTPRDYAAAAAAYDAANRWAPESVGHTTINFLTTPYWSASRGLRVTTVVAAAALLAIAAWLAVAWQRKRPLRPELALAAGALVALGLWDLHFLVRYLPMLNLRPTPGVEERIRRNYGVAPDVGALAALAREVLRPDERVGAIGPPAGWFAPQTICFNLAPRPCVIVKPGEREHAGISGVGRLRDDELDAVVTYRTAALPPGFAPIAGIGPSAVVARRVR